MRSMPTGGCAGHHRLDAVRAHLLEMAGDYQAAIAHYQTAADQATSLPERNYLITQAARLRESAAGPAADDATRQNGALFYWRSRSISSMASGSIVKLLGDQLRSGKGGLGDAARSMRRGSGQHVVELVRQNTAQRAAEKLVAVRKIAAPHGPQNGIAHMVAGDLAEGLRRAIYCAGPGQGSGLVINRRRHGVHNAAAFEGDQHQIAGDAVRQSGRACSISRAWCSGSPVRIRSSSRRWSGWKTGFRISERW